MVTSPLPHRPGTGIRMFDGALRILIVGLAGATVVAAVLAGLSLTERGPIVVPSELDAPYAIRLLGEQQREIVVGSPGNVTGRVNFEIGEESRYIKQAPAVRVDVRVDRDDTDTRIAVSVAGIVALGLGWLVVLNLHHVVRAAKLGDPFAPQNVTRLRWVAASVLALPVVGVAAVAVIARTLESDPPVEPVSPGWGWLVFVVVGIGLLALAEVFKEGAALREFEQETV